MNYKGLVILAAVGIAALLVGSTVLSHSVEAKRKPSQINVYVNNIGKITHKTPLKVCMVEDDSFCFNKAKIVDLQKASNGGQKSKVQVATFSITFSTEFTPKDVSACGRLIDQGNEALDCAYGGSLTKVKSKLWKTTIDYRDLVDKLFG